MFLPKEGDGIPEVILPICSVSFELEKILAPSLAGAPSMINPTLRLGGFLDANSDRTLE